MSLEQHQQLKQRTKAFALRIIRRRRPFLAAVKQM